MAFITTSIHRLIRPTSTVIALKWPTGDTIICDKENITTWTETQFKSISILAERGDSKCLAELGNRYLMGEMGGLPYKGRDYKKAYDCYNKSAEQGDKDGLYGMGLLHMNGLGVEKNFQKAADYFRLSGDKGNPKAYTKLGLLYISGGYGLESDTSRAIEFLQKAAKLNDDEGMYELGKCYKEGIGGMPKDVEKALLLFKRAAKLGHLGSYYYVGEYLCENAPDDIKQNEKWMREGEKWLKRAIKKGDRQALEFYNIMFNKACPSGKY